MVKLLNKAAGEVEFDVVLELLLETSPTVWLSVSRPAEIAFWVALAEVAPSKFPKTAKFDARVTEATREPSSVEITLAILRE